tara:strand:+ start:2002 stop:3231 length:1230 start_codon:yes stop_codon:yes gene_type:complete
MSSISLGKARHTSFLLLSALLLSISVAGNLSVDQTELNFGGSTFEGGDTDTEGLGLINGFSEYNLSNFSFSFSSNGASPLTTNDFTIDFPSEIDVGKSSSLNVVINVPNGMSSVNGELEGTELEVGTLTITAVGTNATGNETISTTSDAIKINVEVKNNIRISGVDYNEGDDTPENVAAASTKDAHIGESVLIEVEFENLFDDGDDTIFEDSDVEIKLVIDGVDEDDGDSSEDVSGGGKDKIDVGFKVDEDDFEVGELYDIRIELSGKDEYGGTHGDVFEFRVRILEEVVVIFDSDNDGVADELDFCPDTLILCSVDESGCALDNDKDLICNDMDTYPNDEDKIQEKSTQVETSETQEEAKQVEDVAEEEIIIGEVNEEQSSGGSVAPFIFGLIVGIIGSACYFLLTKV